MNLIRLEVAVVQRLDLAFDLAQIEEQPLLIGGRSHLHEAPRAQDVFLNRSLDPPHGVGRQAETALRLEALDRLHQADIALGDHFTDRQTIAAIAHGDLSHESQMAGHETMGGLAILVLLVPLGEHVLFLRLKHRKAPDLLEIPGEAGFTGR